MQKNMIALLDYTNLFSLNNSIKSDICKYFNTNMAKTKSLILHQKIDETRNYILELINHNDFMSEVHKKTCRCLNYFESFLVFVSAVSGCVSISAFVSLVGVTVGFVSSTTG